MELSHIKRIAVVGAGLMGHGIAQEFAQAGYQVALNDLTPDRLDRALANIRTNLERLTGLGRLDEKRIPSILAAITTSVDLQQSVSGAQLVIEAIIEDLATKHALYRALEPLCDAETLIASNTSSFMPSLLARELVHPSRFLVAHYFTPPYLIPLVEIVPGPDTHPDTVTTVAKLYDSLGKAPVVLHKEATGFVGNRLQFALYREALSIVTQGIAEPDAVDRVVRNGFGRRLAVAGPFEILDFAGLDTLTAVAAEIFPAIAGASPSDQPLLEFLRQKVASGELGVKSGRGFHDWPPERIEDVKDRLTKALARAGPGA
jgi:3-hydroxybutyryl-CoA dehydrogenase